MSASEIIAEVSQGLIDAGVDAGAGSALLVVLVRSSAETDEPQTPLDPVAIPANPPTLYSLKALDTGIKNFYQAGLIIRTARVIMVEAGVAVPTMTDLLEVRGETYAIQGVHPVAPSGVDLLYKIELAV